MSKLISFDVISYVKIVVLFGIYRNFSIVLTVRLKICRSNVFFLYKTEYACRKIGRALEILRPQFVQTYKTED